MTLARCEIISPWYGSEERCGYRKSEPCLTTLHTIVAILGDVWEPQRLTRQTFFPFSGDYFHALPSRLHIMYKRTTESEIRDFQDAAVESLRRVAPPELVEYADGLFR